MNSTPETDLAVRDMSYRNEIGQLISLHMVDPDFARRLEQQRNRLADLLRQAQTMRPNLLASYGAVPVAVLDYCNKARALLREIWEDA